MPSPRCVSGSAEVARRIRAQLPTGQEFSYLVSESRILYARWSRASRHEPRSSITQLIQGIWREFPENARALLRSRIYSTESPDELSWGMLKVAGKRLTAPLNLAEAAARGHDDTSVRLHEVSFEPAPMDAQLLATAQELRRSGLSDAEVALRLRDSIARSGERYDSDRRVAALLLSQNGELLAAARNSNARNRTLHAEVNLAQGWWQSRREPLPAGSRVLTTLKSCKMCAGMLWEAAADPGRLEVLYLEDDPGPCARHTVLQPGTHERERSARDREDPHLRELRPERPYP